MQILNDSRDDSSQDQGWSSNQIVPEPNASAIEPDGNQHSISVDKVPLIPPKDEQSVEAFLDRKKTPNATGSTSSRQGFGSNTMVDQDAMTNALQSQLGKTFINNYVVKEQDLVCDQHPNKHLENLDKLYKDLSDQYSATDSKREQIPPGVSMFCKKHRKEDGDFKTLHEGDPFIKTGEINQRIYMRDYAVEFKIPASFVVNAHITGNGQEFQGHYYQVVKFVFPDSLRERMGQGKSNTYTELRCMKKTKAVDLVGVGNPVKLETGQHLQTAFSQDGLMFAYLIRTQGKHQIHVVRRKQNDSPEQLLETLRLAQKGTAPKDTASSTIIPILQRSKTVRQADTKKKSSAPLAEDLTFMDESDQQTGIQAHLKFDTNNKALIGWCGRKFFVYDIEKNKLKTHEVLNQIYDRILNMTYTTGDCLDKLVYSDLKNQNTKDLSDQMIKSPKIYLACKKKKFPQLHIFEFYQNLKQQEKVKEEVKNERQEIQFDLTAQVTAKYVRIWQSKMRHHIKIVDYLEQEGDRLPSVHINHNCSMVMFHSARERFILDKREAQNQFHRYMLPLLKVKYDLHYVEEDFEQYGFYVVCSRPQDWQVRIIHTHKALFKIKHTCTVESGKLRVYDLHVNAKKDDPLKKGANQLIVLGMNQNNYVVLESDYTEKEVDKVVHQKADHIMKALKQNSILAGKDKMLYGLPCEMETVDEVREFVFRDYGAFSFCWPSIAFADIKGHIYIANGYGGGEIRQLDMFSEKESGESINICQTFITSKQFLYILAYTDGVYKLYRVNLKASLRLFEYEDKDFDSSEFVNKELLLEYEEDSVATHLFVRDGNSDEDVGVLDDTFVFICHGEDFYQWRLDSKTTDESLSIPIRTTSIVNHQISFGIDNSMYYILKQKQKQMNARQSTALKLQEHEELMVADLQLDGFDEKTKKQSNSQNFKFTVQKLTIGHMKTFPSNIYQEVSHNDELQSFDFDRQAKKLILLFRQQKQDDDNFSSLRKGDFKIKIYDLEQQKIQIDLKIRNPLLIKLLRSGFYGVSGGHIYHANSVVKIRYDLLEQFIDNQNVSVTNLTEKELFDYYHDIMDIPDGHAINSSQLLFSNQNNRMCFIIEDQSKFEHPTTLRVTPFLHDRRIFLDIPRELKDRNFFLTSMEIDRSRLIKYNRSVSLKDTPTNAQIKRQLTFSEQAQKSDEKNELNIESVRFIIRINFTHSKMYVFNTNGILVRRIPFQSLTDMYGEPVSASNDGRYIVLKQPMNYLKNTIKYLEEEENQEKKNEQVHQALKFTIFEVTPFGLLKIKTVDLWEGINKFFGPDNAQAKKDFIENNQELLYPPSLKLLTKKTSMQIFVNNDCDVLVKINKRNSKEYDIAHDDHEHGDHDCADHHDKPVMKDNALVRAFSSYEEFKDHKLESSKRKKICDELSNWEGETIFYLEQANFGIEDDEQHDLLGENKMSWNKIRSNMLFWFDKYHQKLAHGSVVEFNNKYILFWDDKRAHYLRIADLLDGDTPLMGKIDIDLNIQDYNNFPRLDKIHPSPDPDKVSIVIANDFDKHTIVNWNIEKSFEYNNVQVEGPFFITFDKHKSKDGSHIESQTLIISEKMTCFCEMGCNITAYQPDMNNITNMFNQSPYTNVFKMGNMGANKGIRFDGKNNNWIVFDSYLSLPFSYMSFMIKDKIEKNEADLRDNVFDIEPFNYIYNKSTSFMDDKFTRMDTEKLRWALSNIKKLDPEHLGLLKYTTWNSFYTEPNFMEFMGSKSEVDFRRFFRRSALSIALSFRNATGVETVLEYMAQSEHDASPQFYDLYESLVEFENFIPYLGSLTIQTTEMRNNQTFKSKKRNYKDTFSAFYLFLRRACCYCDWRSPLHSNLGSMILQAKSTNTIIHDDNYYKFELQKRHENDHNYEIHPEAYHEYPVRIQAIQSGWMFADENDAKEIQHSRLSFLKAIYESDNNDYYFVPYIQILTAHMFEKFVHKEKDLFNVLYLLGDTLLFFFQFLILFIQHTNVKIDSKVSIEADASSKSQWRQEGIDPDGNFVTYENVGDFLQTQLIILSPQLFFGAYNILVTTAKIWGTSCSKIAKEISLLILDIGVKVLLAFQVWERFEFSFKRQRFNVKTGIVYPQDTKGKIVSRQDAIACQNDPNCVLKASVTFPYYKQIFDLLLISVFINLIFILCKLINRLRIFFIQMAEFTDLIYTIVSKLLAFLGFSIIFAILASILFATLGQYQLKVDMWYIYQSQIVGSVPEGWVKDKAARESMIDNALEDQQDEIGYAKYNDVYSSIFHALIYIYSFFLGDADSSAFDFTKRGANQSLATFGLYVAFISFTILLMIILLNMIIAIMGEAQTQRASQGLPVRYKHRMNFIISRYEAIVGNYGNIITSYIIDPITKCSCKRLAYRNSDSKYIVGVTSLQEEAAEKQETVDVSLFNDRIDNLADKHQINEIILNDIKMEVRRLKKIAK